MKSLFLLATFMLLSSISAHDKTYLTPDEIQIREQGIFVFLQQNWVQAPALHSDASGVYVDQFGAWLCGRCGQWTTGWFVCEHCGNPK